MTVEIATGKAKCVACSETIPKGANCWHQRVNSRARPFFCCSCLGSMHRQVSGLSTVFRYEVWRLEQGTPEETHMAKRAESSDRPNSDGPWLVEIEDMAHAEEAIALAEGIPTENVRLSMGPAGYGLSSSPRNFGADSKTVIFFAEIPNNRV